ncbi:MAG TPA: DUF4215 domain-containing protein, partial [Myxococcota bacterium]|nr:DUF4215 domain-containing protein [Myxococcota bacterium]
MRIRHGALLASTAIMTLGAVPVHAQGVPPWLKVSEVLGGTYAAPDAQYVVLRLSSNGHGQNAVAGYTIVALDALGTELGRTVLPSDVANGRHGDAILLANEAAIKAFRIATDAPFFPQLLRRKAGAIAVIPMVQDPNDPNGRVLASDPNTFDDWFMWGNFRLTDDDDQPVPGANPPFNQFGGGLPLGAVAQRLTLSGNSQEDFHLVSAPWPENNSRAIANLPPSVCGDGELEGLEQCDDGGNAPGDGCSATCTVELNVGDARCANGELEAGETCDDRNTSNGDGCSAMCQYENPRAIPAPVCGDRLLESGEQCDDGGAAAGGGCSATCQVEGGYLPTCGNHVADPNEQCDDGNGDAGDGCSPGCLWE